MAPQQITGFILSLAIYAYMAYCIMEIANKTDTPNSWLAWLPIANLYLLLNIAKKPWWWLLVFIFSPLVYFFTSLFSIFILGPLVILILTGLLMIILVIMTLRMWVGVITAVGKPGWIVIFMLIPLVNLIFLGYLAFGSTSSFDKTQQPVQK